MSESRVAEEIIEICRRLHARNMLASADGNVSFRLSDDRILITPTGISKAFMRPEEMAVITLENRVLSGKPSGERLMHLEVYRRCSKAKAVVHAHPPTAVAWSVARPGLKELPADCLSELILACGRVPVVPFAQPGTQDMGDKLAPFLPECRVLLLARHGGLSWGEDLAEAYGGMERLEHTAQILRDAHLLGGLSSLAPNEVAALRELRKKLGERTL